MSGYLEQKEIEESWKRFLEAWEGKTICKFVRDGTEYEVVFSTKEPTNQYYDSEKWKAVREKATKPPLGLTPKRIIKLKRMQDIYAAIGRYLNVCKDVPREWIIEFDELATELKTMKEETK